MGDEAVPPPPLGAAELSRIEAEAIARFGPLYAAMDVADWLRRIDPAIRDAADHVAGRWIDYDLTDAGADYPEPATPTRHGTLICTTLRTGSTLLGESLYRVGGFGCPCEYYMEDAGPRLYGRWGAGDFREYHGALLRHRTDAGGAFGAKLFWLDVPNVLAGVDERDAATRLRSAADDPDSPRMRVVHRTLASVMGRLLPAPRYVYLRREDRVAQAVSTLIATQSGNWRSTDGITGAPNPVYSYPALLALIGWFWRCDRHWEAFFRDAGITPCRVSYAELDTALGSTVRRIGETLGTPVPERALVEFATPRLQRQGSSLNGEFARRFLAEFRN